MGIARGGRARNGQPLRRRARSPRASNSAVAASTIRRRVCSARSARRDRPAGGGLTDELTKGSMWAVGVVVLDVLAQHDVEATYSDDQEVGSSTSTRRQPETA